jgi:hypothetical protein
MLAFMAGLALLLVPPHPEGWRVLGVAIAAAGGVTELAWLVSVGKSRLLAPVRSLVFPLRRLLPGYEQIRPTVEKRWSRELEHGALLDSVIEVDGWRHQAEVPSPVDEVDGSRRQAEVTSPVSEPTAATHVGDEDKGR